MNIEFFQQLDSTNSYIERNARTMQSMTCVAAHTQTAGRGQRGNSWEAEPGRNLTLSLFWRPEDFPASRQFHISEAVAIAVKDFLMHHGIEARIKWPNDIYVGDRKICGILIKHSLCGPNIAYTVIGIGINVNQTFFVSDAPNPVSMSQISGSAYDLETLLADLAKTLEKNLLLVSDTERWGGFHSNFKSSLWRGDGKEYPFVEASSGERFMAKVCDVDPQGYLTLIDSSGLQRRYAFKEVSWPL